MWSICYKSVYFCCPQCCSFQHWGHLPHPSTCQNLLLMILTPLLPSQWNSPWRQNTVMSYETHQNMKKKREPTDSADIRCHCKITHSSTRGQEWNSGHKQRIKLQKWQFMRRRIKRNNGPKVYTDDNCCDGRYIYIDCLWNECSSSNMGDMTLNWFEWCK